MRVGDIDVRSAGGLTTLSARITWEEVRRPESRIFFETESRFLQGVSPNPAALLIGLFLPAMCLGERRVLVEGTLSPRLHDGLLTAMLHFSRWYGFRPIAIEAAEGTSPGRPTCPPRVASFLSGGVDSLATLRVNRLDYPLEHPDSIRDAFFVRGLEGRANAALVERTLQSFAEEAGVTLIPVSTNVNRLDGRQPFQVKIYSGAFFAAIAHLFSGRVSTAVLASTHQVLELEPWGTHPLVDPLYASEELSIRHDGGRFWRYEKVALVSSWEAALRALRPCWNPYVGADLLNCGYCEKCLRTMTELLVHGKLGLCTTFPAADVTPELLSSLRTQQTRYDGADRERWIREACLTIGHGAAMFWRCLVDPLRATGRRDLAEVIRAKLEELERQQTGGAGWRGVGRRTRKRLGKGLRRACGAVQRLRSRPSLGSEIIWPGDMR